MTEDFNSNVHPIRPETDKSARPIESLTFEESAARELIGVNAPISSATSLISSCAQLEALIDGLSEGEALIARLETVDAKSGGLSLEITGSAESQDAAKDRSATLGRLLDGALSSALPHIEIEPRTRPNSDVELPFHRVLAPAGVALPLCDPPGRERGKTGPRGLSENRNGRLQDSIVFSPPAAGIHLAGLGAALAAIDTPIAIEVRLRKAPFDASLLKKIHEGRTRIAERLHSDTGKLIRDQRYSEADRRLETLGLAPYAISLGVAVQSARPLASCELSALSAALFGRPHDDAQTGHLAELRSLYPREEAVQSFLGILAAAIGPALERRHLAKLEGLEGNIIGKLKSGTVIRMAVAHPRSHTYVIGRSGTGKSTFLLNQILQDIENGHAVVLIDPHGDLWADVRDRLPSRRRKDVQLVHMGDPALQPKLNLLELGPGEPAEERSRVADTLYQLIRRMMFSGLTVDATGPMFNKYFRAAVMLLLEGEGAKASFAQFEAIFGDEDYRDELRARDTVSEQTRQQWNQILNVSSSSDHSLDNVTPWITSKLTLLTQSTILRPILSATRSDLDFDDVLAHKKVCLINLANGRIGTEAASLLGGILTIHLEQAAKRQESKRADERHQASVYLDEFQTFASELLRPLMAETRKFGLRVTLANQTLSQLVNNDVSGGVLREVLGNCSNTIAFGVEIEDARYLRPRFGGSIDVDTLVGQPNYQAICQFQTRTGALGPFLVKTSPPPPVPGDKTD